MRDSVKISTCLVLKKLSFKYLFFTCWLRRYANAWRWTKVCQLFLSKLSLEGLSGPLWFDYLHSVTGNVNLILMILLLLLFSWQAFCVLSTPLMVPHVDYWIIFQLRVRFVWFTMYQSSLKQLRKSPHKQMFPDHQAAVEFLWFKFLL